MIKTRGFGDEPWGRVLNPLQLYNITGGKEFQVKGNLFDCSQIWTVDMTCAFSHY